MVKAEIAFHHCISHCLLFRIYIDFRKGAKLMIQIGKECLVEFWITCMTAEPRDHWAWTTRTRVEGKEVVEFSQAGWITFGPEPFDSFRDQFVIIREATRNVCESLCSLIHVSQAEA